MIQSTDDNLPEPGLHEHACGRVIHLATFPLPNGDPAVVDIVGGLHCHEIGPRPAIIV